MATAVVNVILGALILVVAVCEAHPCVSAFATLDEQGQHVIITEGKPTENAIAWGSYSDNIESSGWGYLELESNASYADHIQAYAAGALEGYLTHDRIQMQWNNMYAEYCDNQTEFCDRLRGFLSENMVYSRRQELKHQGSDPYWHMVHLQMKQLAGLSDAFEHEPLDVKRQLTNVTRVLFFNIEGDLLDLEHALKRTPDTMSVSIVPACSALIKVVGDNQDIFFAHDSWFLYRSMLRIQKKYTFPWHYVKGSSKVVPGHTVTMSSYPGKLVSLDDFYLTSAGLAITETSIDNNNASLWSHIDPRNAPLTWVRAAVANRLAVSGAEWVSMFRRLNSGTYNNQWMVLDYKLFTPGEPIGKDTLWILEQMPTITKAKDMSSQLRTEGYWPSYNVAYFPSIFNISGQQEMVKKYGNYYSYAMAPRAQIFRRDHVKVINMTSMMTIMRYNDYTHDPASQCNCTPPYNPTYAIASRYDLLDPEGSYDVPMKRRAVGATDMKLTNYELFKELQFIATNSPTYDDLPPFQWSSSGFQEKHEGHPDLWFFPPTLHEWGNC